MTRAGDRRALPAALTLEHIEARLRAAPPAEGESFFGARAGVAVVLREPARGRDVDLLLIRRAAREGDPWSGHMAFPGGGQDEGDVDIEATARRETLEEIGLDLAAAARRIGRLPDARTLRAPRLLTITPIVYALAAPEPPPLRLSDEVAATFWVPLGALASGAHDGTHVWRLGGVPLRMPCWTWEECVIWGLTYRMIGTLLERLR